MSERPPLEEMRDNAGMLDRYVVAAIIDYAIALECAARERRIDRLVELAAGALSRAIPGHEGVHGPMWESPETAAEIARATLAAIEAGEEGK